MALPIPIDNSEMRFCRDCGGGMVPLGQFRICLNTTQNGNAKNPKDVCKTLGRMTRSFCEFDGTAVNLGQLKCPVCGRSALIP
jgi:hypothetical protein